ncbi:hypothetical protein CQA66_00085 [Helicobacter aurati]|uniref:Beta-ketoacyl synthase-like N-terminal domain-containing protein n=1 Tax=Helicobacter aurati TaxID=137778 RepID=A0A3D8J9U0_9HELI|nr:beta-ketoacyl synthase chain length factor [Helicobacter aurati]RDU73634.1 hypothetical protein CQA66_00085 [Helicobacter aurati]
MRESSEQTNSFVLNILQHESIIAPHFDKALYDNCIESTILENYKQDFDLAHIPALERRRLNNAAKCAFTLLPRFQHIQKPLIVFHSPTGEINRCFAMLHSLAKENLVSPTTFSLSVLNATPALVAIATQNYNEITAISSNCLEYALLNAYITLCDYQSNHSFPNQEALILSYYEKLNTTLPNTDATSQHTSESYFMTILHIALANHPNSMLNCTISYEQSKQCHKLFPEMLSELSFLIALHNSKHSALPMAYQIDDGNLLWNHELIH